MGVTVQAMRAFVALTETENFTYAAERCYMTQPAFSRLISGFDRPEIRSSRGLAWRRDNTNPSIGLLCRLLDEIVSDDETVGIGSYALERVPAAIVANQTAGVDGVSGATASTNAILASVRDSLTEAGADMSVFNKAPEAAPAVDETYDTDVVVVGAGAAGFSAAVRAMQEGANVIVVEKMDIPGGILLNAEGKRFCNEVNYRDIVAGHILEQTGAYAYIVFNQDLYDSNGNIPTYDKVGIVSHCESLADITAYIGCDELRQVIEANPRMHSAKRLFLFRFLADRDGLFLGFLLRALLRIQDKTRMLQNIL